MRLVIDMQGAQSSGSRNRGIGRYTTSLTKALLQLRGADEVFLVLNGAFIDTIEPIRVEFAELLPIENIRVWLPPQPCNAATPQNKVNRQAAELIREAFIGALLPDVVLVTSLFEGLGDDAVTSVGLLTSVLPTAVVLYDLIPLIHRGIYLGNPVVEGWYLNKLDQLRRANLLLSISASSGREGVEHLGFNNHQVTNISTACDAHFHAVHLTQPTRDGLARRYHLHRPFVMYTGGIDHRKNIEGLIRAYAALPPGLRVTHQLAVVCSVQAVERERLLQLAKSQGLTDDELVMTGFVSEEDLVSLYNACKLFVFPSWHEGFGLPALEAMACGRAVIGANTSSVPEVIGRDDALFDPRSDQAITTKMAQVLTDDAYRKELEAHSLKQAASFSWSQTAQTAWDALRELPAPTLQPTGAIRRPKLAYLSPVPNGKSGIADYSAELLPELARHYQIDVVVFQDEPVQDRWLLANCSVRSVDWFRTHAADFDRVLYHFGNSHFHGHMFDLLREIPGTVVLHDFFLAHILAHMDFLVPKSGRWLKSLLASHGWPAVHMRHSVKDTTDAVWAYPCNLPMLQIARGIIVHSENSLHLTKHWYGNIETKDWALIPLLRVPALGSDKAAARAALFVGEDEFVVCSFGLLGRTKLNHRLLKAWMASPLAANKFCRLVFVGQNEGGAYGVEIVTTIATSGAAATITGWIDAEVYRQWLAVADIAVQLRTQSRGETSAAVLDCLNFGVATIVNEHGSLADLQGDVVFKMPDKFTDGDLASALTKLWQHESFRLSMGQRGHQHILRSHQPRHCADLYHQAIENFYAHGGTGPFGVIGALEVLTDKMDECAKLRIAQTLADNFPPSPRRPQLLIDVSELVMRDSRSGIQRVVRALLLPLLMNPPDGWQVEAVYANPREPGYRYARQFTCDFLGLPADWADDAVVEIWAGDTFLALDLQPEVISFQTTVLQGWRARGVKVLVVVYDLLPVLFPHAFREGTALGHQKWLNLIAGFDGVLAISKTVADDFSEWLAVYCPNRRKVPLQLHYFHLGADIENSAPTTGYSGRAWAALTTIGHAPSFLMVGTIEPRKGHELVLEAFNLLWAQGVDVNLVIVGKQGWLVEALIEQLRVHPQAGQHLYWLEDASDECLSALYAQSTCLIAASEGEGFGLPLIEAAKFKLPILARDIPVFREVAGEYASYFAADTDAVALMQTITQWLSPSTAKGPPQSEGMPWLTWSESAQKVADIVQCFSPPYKTWLPDDVIRFWGNDIRLSTQIGKRHRQAVHSTGQAGFLVYGPYLPLKAGHYKVLLSGACVHWTGDETFDISCAGGGAVLLHVALTAEPAGNWSKVLEFTLQNNVTDFEVRLWVSSEADLSLSGIEISINS